jgi:hypothetical protein
MDEMAKLLDTASKLGPLGIALVMGYFYYKTNQERERFLQIILEVIPKTTDSINKMRRIVAGKHDVDDEET